MSAQDQIHEFRQWDLDTRQQKADDIDAMIADLTETAAALESEIRQAEAEARISDVRDLAYPTAAQAFRARLQNICDTLKLLAREQITAREALRSGAAPARTSSARR